MSELLPITRDCRDTPTPFSKRFSYILPSSFLPLLLSLPPFLFFSVAVSFSLSVTQSVCSIIISMVTITDVKLSLMYYGSNLFLSSARSLCPLLSSVASSSSPSHAVLLRDSLAAVSQMLLSSTSHLLHMQSGQNQTFNLEAYAVPVPAQIHNHVIPMGCSRSQAVRLSREA